MLLKLFFQDLSDPNEFLETVKTDLFTEDVYVFTPKGEVKEMMKDGYNDHQIRVAMKKEGMKTISDKLKDMLIVGETSYEEAIRVGLMDG